MHETPSCCGTACGWPHGRHQARGRSPNLVLLLEPCERASLIAATEVLEVHEHGVIGAGSHIVLDHDAAPVGVSLRALVILVVQIAGACDEAMLRFRRNEPDAIEQRLLVPHGETMADLLEPIVYGARERATGQGLVEIVAIADAVNPHRHEEVMNLPIRRLEIVQPDRALKSRIFLNGYRDAVLMSAPEQVEFRLETGLSRRGPKHLDALVAGLHVARVPAPFH